MNQTHLDPTAVDLHGRASDARFEPGGWRYRALAVVCFALVAICFGLDLITPPGIANAIAYLAAVLLSVRLYNARFTLIIATLASVATIFGLLYKAVDGVSPLFAATNRVLIVCAIWVTALLGLLLIREAKRRREVQGSLDDATMRLVEMQLHESEERFRLAVEAVEDYAIVQLDADGRVSSWNRGAERITGYTSDDVIGEHVSMFYTPGAREADLPQRMLSQAASQGRYLVEGWCMRKDGSRFWSSVVVTAMHDENRRLRGYLKITRDMTERKRLEKQIVDLTMQEQQRIGRELHDSFGQQVTGIALLAANLKRTLEARGAPEAERAASLIDVIEDARSQVRALTKGLMPVEVDANGLQSALQELAETIESTYDLQCAFRCTTSVNVENNTAATHLFKIAQEAIHNAVKHAAATRVTVSLSERDAVVTLSVRDNGKGIDEEANHNEGNGLRIMRYRAGLIDATLDIRPAPRSGTLVSCSVHRESRAGRPPAETHTS